MWYKLNSGEFLSCEILLATRAMFVSMPSFSLIRREWGMCSTMRSVTDSLYQCDGLCVPMWRDFFVFFWHLLFFTNVTRIFFHCDGREVPLWQDIFSCTKMPFYQCAGMSMYQCASSPFSPLNCSNCVLEIVSSSLPWGFQGQRQGACAVVRKMDRILSAYTEEDGLDDAKGEFFPFFASR